MDGHAINWCEEWTSCVTTEEVSEVPGLVTKGEDKYKYTEFLRVTKIYTQNLSVINSGAQ